MTFDRLDGAGTNAELLKFGKGAVSVITAGAALFSFLGEQMGRGPILALGMPTPTGLLEFGLEPEPVEPITDPSGNLITDSSGNRIVAPQD